MFTELEKPEFGGITLALNISTLYSKAGNKITVVVVIAVTIAAWRDRSDVCVT